MPKINKAANLRSYYSISKQANKIAIDASQIAGYARKKDLEHIVYNLETLIKKTTVMTKTIKRLESKISQK